VRRRQNKGIKAFECCVIAGRWHQCKYVLGNFSETEEKSSMVRVVIHRKVFTLKKSRKLDGISIPYSY
jgi:hypothetical protein